MTSKERIDYLVRLAGGRAEMSRKLGVNYQDVNSWYVRGKVTMSCIDSFHQIFPWLNLHWLIYGEGDVELYGKERDKVLKSLEALEKESMAFKDALNKKINEIKEYDTRNIAKARHNR